MNAAPAGDVQAATEAPATPAAAPDDAPKS
jgi:hypothetical protein